MTTVYIGFEGTVPINRAQANRLTGYYNSLHTEHGYLKRAYNRQAIVAVDTALAAIGLRFTPMSTEGEGYVLDYTP